VVNCDVASASVSLHTRLVLWRFISSFLTLTLNGSTLTSHGGQIQVKALVTLADERSKTIDARHQWIVTVVCCRSTLVYVYMHATTHSLLVEIALQSPCK